MARPWPVFLSRAMYGDSPVALHVGDRISWNMLMVDGAVAGWPRDILVPTFVEITDPPAGARGGLVARSADLTVAWGGVAPAGSAVSVLGGLVADWFNPPFQTIVSGSITRLYLAWETSADCEDERRDGSLRLAETGEVRSLSSAGVVDDSHVAGLMAELEVSSSRVAPFPPR
jgi:hypothetical protein